MAPEAGLIRVRSNADIERQQREQDAFIKALSAPAPVDSLYQHVLDMFHAAATHRDSRSITERYLKCKRQREGEYDPDKLEKIKKQGRSETFFNITATKAAALENWIHDMLGSVEEKPWSLKATPLPSLPEDVTQLIIERVLSEFPYPGPGAERPDPATVQQRALDIYDDALSETQKDAQKRVDRMEQRIADQFAEGGFAAALDEFINALSTYPVAILKGPVIRRQRRLHWYRGKIEVTEQEIPTWSCVSPLKFYPSPTARAPQDSYICELVEFDPTDLAAMRGAEGWNAKALDDILAAYKQGENIETPHVRQHIDGYETAFDTVEKDPEKGRYNTITGIEFWGAVQAGLLKDWGVKGVDDENAFVEIAAILIGKHVAYVIQNPDPLGRHPYSVTSFCKLSGSMIGQALAEQIRDCQNSSNATHRALIDNLAIAAGPQVGIDVDSVDAGEDIANIFPFKIWTFHGKAAIGGKGPVDFWQPEIHAEEFIRVADYFSRQADDRTLIPRFAHGDEDIGGMGRTATGATILMSAGARGIKRVVGHMDEDVLRPTIERMYAWNLKYLPDKSIKGDAFVVPKGVLGAVVREQTQLRRQEFLSRTLNDVDMQIMGIEGRATVLRAVAKQLDLAVEDIIPPPEEMRRRYQQNIIAQMPEIGTGGPSGTPPGVAGEPVSAGIARGENSELG